MGSLCVVPSVGFNSPSPIINNPGELESQFETNVAKGGHIILKLFINASLLSELKPSINSTMYVFSSLNIEYMV